MIWTHWTRKEIVLAATILALAFAASFLAIMLVRPHPVASSVLTEWQCTKTAGVMTVCTRRSRPEPRRGAAAAIAVAQS